MTLPHRHIAKGMIIGLILALLATLLFALSLLIGPVRIPCHEVALILLGETSTKSSWQYIVLETRLAPGSDGYTLWCVTGSQRPDATDGFSQPPSGSRRLRR